MINGEISIRKIDNGYILEVNGEYVSPSPLNRLMSWDMNVLKSETKCYTNLESLFERIREVYNEPADTDNTKLHTTNADSS